MGLRFGRYETVREIAAGGMATVYLGRAVGEGGFERLVAIKVMHPHLSRDGEFVAMFLDEARLAARIRHPNVVATMDVQTSGEGMFLVMDYIEGASLQEIRRYLKKSGDPLPIGIAIRVMLDTLTGLHAAHELTGDDGQLLHLVHRDVSPQNVLVGKDGVSRLTDFGVARASARLSSTRGGQLKGKLNYMPPEQIMAEGVDRRSDVYSAGVVLWEALVGRRAFQAKSEGAVVHAIIQGIAQAPRERNERVAEAISRACMRALSLEREDRHPTAAAFADELEDAARQAGLLLPSSRAVGTFMTTILPALELQRPSERGLTPPSFSQASLDRGLPAAEVVSSPSVVTGPPTPAVPSDSLTRTEAVLTKAPGFKLAPGTAVLGIAAVVVAAAAVAATVIIASNDAVPAPAGASSSAPAAGEPSGLTEPAEPTAPVESTSTAAPAPDAGGVASAEPTSEPQRPARPWRPRSTAKPSLTDYDPDEL